MGLGGVSELPEGMDRPVELKVFTTIVACDINFYEGGVANHDFCGE